VRYLWVDFLCTVQDGNIAENLEQIKSMDIIRAASYLDIIAVKKGGSVSVNIGIVTNVEVQSGSCEFDSKQLIKEIKLDFRLGFCMGLCMVRKPKTGRWKAKPEAESLKRNSS
jgi:Heterokaryon incompatibility protein (HET).